MRPYQQGEMDGLCGIYSSINALRLIEKQVSFDKCYELTQDWLIALEKRRGKVANVVIDGLGVHDLNFVLTLMCEKFGIKKYRPFCKKANVSLKVYWDTMKQFFAEGNSRSVVLGYHGFFDDGHWSVIKTATNKTIFLFDSCNGKYLRRSRCTTREINNKRPIGICPAQTFFLFKP